MNDGLNAAKRAVILDILSKWANKIRRVDVFGSRALGTQRASPDLDLALHGALDAAAVNRIWTLFQESNLPFSVDVKHYEATGFAPLRAHMDSVRKTLFTQDDLLQHAAQAIGQFEKL